MLRRLKITLVSLAALAISAACSPKPTQQTPTITCYELVVPTDTPGPIVTCYTASASPPTFTPTPICYTPTASPRPFTPTPTTFTSPISPLPTPTPAPEARHLLRERLLAEGRFPQDVARQLES